MTRSKMSCRLRYYGHAMSIALAIMLLRPNIQS